MTANKAMLALHGQALAEAAEAKGHVIRFEAAVAGGIPVVNSRIHEEGELLASSHEEDGTRITARVNEDLAGELALFASHR